MTAIEPSQIARELRLKMELAKLLPEEIEITELVNFQWKSGNYKGEMIRDTEWEHICVLAENPTGVWLPTLEELIEEVLEFRGVEFE